jgi:hypothetical protein
VESIKDLPLIACLGWGSLVWNQEDLVTDGPWRNDGPLLPVEFARQSMRGASAGALTLILMPRYHALVRSLWALLPVATARDARDALRKRERIPASGGHRSIALWTNSDTSEPVVAEISSWARERELSAVVWTALGPRFGGEENRIPTADEAVNYLRRLVGRERENAERYVRMAPRQVETPYRRRFEAELGWTPIGEL